MTLGTKLGPYEILAPIGAGGMGEVYKARDTRLDRTVAVKVSKEKFSERFEREARAVAALNHPHICTLHDVGPDYLVMELVEGTPLKGPLPLAKAIEYSAQILDALDAAHRKGIIHRDLKPANILVTRQGIKLLDFGLAKVAGPLKETDATLTQALTGTGQIVGTLQYMSPEQLQGGEADARSDLFAFGCVLYEMLTGKRAFDGANAASVIAAILERPAPSVADVAPPALDRALKRCLEKDPESRWQNARDLKAVLDWIGQAGAEASQPVKAPRKAWPAWALAVIAIVLAVVLGVLHLREPTDEPQLLKFSIAAPRSGPFDNASVPAVSPDGRHIAFVAGTLGQEALWVRDLDSLTARALPGTEGAYEPFWSPDGRFLAFFSYGKLKKIDLAGGPPLTLCDVTVGRGGTWNQQGEIVFAPSLTGGLFRVSAAGGIPMPLTSPDKASGEVSHRFPWFLPDGRHFLYIARSSDPAKTKIFIGDLDSKMRHEVTTSSSNAAYAAGHLLYLRERTLMAQPFDLAKLETAGDPVPVASQIDISGQQVQGQFSVSQNARVLAFTSTSGEGSLQLTWFDRSGKVLGTVGTPNNDLIRPRISPNGDMVAVTRVDMQTGNINPWLHDLNRQTATRFTNEPNNNSPVWSPDGQRIAFRVQRNGTSTLHWKPTTGVVQDELLETTLAYGIAGDWSPDSRYLMLMVPGPKTGYDLWVLPLFGDRKPFPYLQSEANEVTPRFSPNGQWLAYASDETGPYEAYVASFPKPSAKWQVSINGGRSPVWSHDGKELFFIGADGKMMAAEVKTGTKFEASPPKVLFETHLGTSPDFDVSKDGRFLIPTLIEQSGNAPMTVIVNWTAGLKK